MTNNMLCDYATGEPIRPATRQEFEASLAQSSQDCGRGVIDVNGRPCYVEGEVWTEGPLPSASEAWAQARAEREAFKALRRSRGF